MTSPLSRVAQFAGALALVAGIAEAQTLNPTKPSQKIYFEELLDGSILAADMLGQYHFANFQEYAKSSFFVNNEMRCASSKLVLPLGFGTTSDCSSSNTNPDPGFDPGPIHTIDVVWHVIMNTNGAGNVSDTAIDQQMAVLNNRFAASGVAFNHAGTTRTTNRSWYNDRGNYYDTLAWDTTQYLNIYTNTASGNLGYAYVPSGGGVVGNTWDRIVIYWPSVGNPAPYGPPYDLGLTTVHEVGHYLGLYHTFDGGCVSTSGCNQNGDLICDTNPESNPNFSPCTRTTCGSPDPTNNYMDYSDDVCMDEFTTEQIRRMRCTLDNFRFGLLGGGNNNPPGANSNPSPANGATGVSTSANLSWTAGADATSHDVYFNGSFQGNQAGTTFDPGALASGTTYSWRVDSVNANGTTTGSTWSFTTASGGGGISLTANGYKVKGVHTIDLSWSGASGGNVEIYRDGSLLTTTANDGAYTDDTGNKGGGVTYTYQVCETGGGACSNTASTVF